MRGLINPISRRELSTLTDSWFDDVWNEMHRIFDPTVDVFRTRSSYPKVNISEDDEKFLIEAAVPGLTKEDVSVTIKDGVLTISGKKQNSSESDKDGYLVREMHRSSFARAITVDESKFLLENISATVDKGVLSVTLPKRQEEKKEEQVRRIEVC